MKKKAERKEGTFSIEEVFSIVPEFDKRQKKTRVVFHEDEIKVTSVRLQSFKKYGPVCVHCGLQGQFFVKERNIPTERYHFNLYGIDEKGEEILFTRDHIIAKSKGGSDNINNMQVLCEPCNLKKGTNIASSSLVNKKNSHIKTS